MAWKLFQQVILLRMAWKLFQQVLCWNAMVGEVSGAPYTSWIVFHYMYMKFNHYSTLLPCYYGTDLTTSLNMRQHCDAVHVPNTVHMECPKTLIQKVQTLKCFFSGHWGSLTHQVFCQAFLMQYWRLTKYTELEGKDSQWPGSKHLSVSALFVSSSLGHLGKQLAKIMAGSCER